MLQNDLAAGLRHFNWERLKKGQEQISEDAAIALGLLLALPALVLVAEYSHNDSSAALVEFEGEGEHGDDLDRDSVQFAGAVYPLPRGIHRSRYQ